MFRSVSLLEKVTNRSAAAVLSVYVLSFSILKNAKCPLKLNRVLLKISKFYKRVVTKLSLHVEEGLIPLMQ